MTYAIVTGASFGIGKAIANSLSADHKVIACARRLHLIEESESIIPYGLDITNSSSLDYLEEFISDKEISIIVNCAGGGTSDFKDNILNQEFDDMNNDFILNVSSTFNLIKRVVPRMNPSKNPIVINITSVSGHEIFNTSPSYTVAKHAQAVMTDILRRDLSKLGIRVSEIIPSSVNSNSNPEMSGRSLDPSDIADLVRHICNTKPHIDINTISISHVKEVPFCS
jgi:NADP-dependent 3-hydroxy acid dehydrogenase YdfG